ncbi:MAG: nucleotide pyrophosphohydrolase [Methanomethylophilus sp.]
MDSECTVAQLEKLAADFCRERDWDQYHNPKDLAIGIASEAGELLEIFRFKDPQEFKPMQDSPHYEEIREELADVLYFVLRFAQTNNIDLEDALRDKLRKNAEKYPVEKCRGKNLKYDEL